MVEKRRCKRCGKVKFLRAKGMCPHCYNYYGREKRTCINCKKIKVIHAKGFCFPCYCKLFHYDKIKLSNLNRLYPGLSMKEYKKFTKKCVICGFSYFVDLHHLDGNRKNNDLKNLIGLCPNHHKMLEYGHKEKILKLLGEKKVL